MRVTVLIYANNNNAEIKLITRFMRIHLCVFICDEVVWSRGGGTSQIRRTIQEIEKSRQEIQTGNF